jgi:hypothetical protein
LFSNKNGQFNYGRPRQNYHELSIDNCADPDTKDALQFLMTREITLMNALKISGIKPQECGNGGNFRQATPDAADTIRK